MFAVQDEAADDRSSVLLYSLAHAVQYSYCSSSHSYEYSSIHAGRRRRGSFPDILILVVATGIVLFGSLGGAVPYRKL